MKGCWRGGKRTPEEKDSFVSRTRFDSNVESRRLKALISACVQECLDSLHAASFLSGPSASPGTSGRARPKISSSARHPSYNQHVLSESEKRPSIPRPRTMACEKSDGGLFFLQSELNDLAECQYAEQSGKPTEFGRTSKSNCAIVRRSKCRTTADLVAGLKRSARHAGPQPEDPETNH